MPAARSMIGILLCALAAGCAAGPVAAPPGARGETGPLSVDPSLLGQTLDKAVETAPPRPAAKEEAVVALTPPLPAPHQPAVSGDEAIGIEPVARAQEAPPASGSRSAAKPAPAPATAPVEVSAARPQATAPAKVSAALPAIEQPRKTDAPSQAAAKVEPPLDLAALKGRLRDTNAIGLFTKLALKNDVDDLLKQFRAHYQSGQKTGVASLRRPYDMLVLKVLAVVQDNDPSLARTIAGSREAIWGILADPEKFRTLT